jgi:hypothetical protein
MAAATTATKTEKTVERTAEIANTQAMLGLPSPDSLKPEHNNKILMSIDTEWCSRGGNFPLLEIGVALLDIRDVYNLDPATSHDAGYFKHIKVYHFRFKESRHIKNKAGWFSSDYNRADKYQYGTSEFINRSHIEEAMSKILQVPDNRNPGEVCKLQMINHGAGRTSASSVASRSRPST